MRYLFVFAFLFAVLFLACNDTATSKESDPQPATVAPEAAGDPAPKSPGEAATGRHGLRNMFFLHHSTGSGVVMKGDIRGHIAEYNAAHGTRFEFWDHGYERNGLTDWTGKKTGGTYGPMTDKTNPPHLHALWTSNEPKWKDLRETILANHEVISFKSCYPACKIDSDEKLAQYKDWYLEMRSFFDTRPDKLFIVMTPPPLNPAATNSAQAKRAREFSNWLKSPEYTAGHPNVACFDLFDVLAQPDDGSSEANMLRADYRKGDDSHPIEPGYKAAAAAMAEVFCSAAAAY